MSLIRPTCLSNIESYLKEMRILVLRSGVIPEKYDSILERAKDLNDCDLERLQNCLSDVMGFQWKLAYEVWILPTISHPEKAEEVWKMYDAMELEGNPEQFMLRDKLRDLNIEIRRIIALCLPRKVTRKSDLRKSDVQQQIQ